MPWLLRFQPNQTYRIAATDHKIDDDDGGNIVNIFIKNQLEYTDGDFGLDNW